MYEFYFSSLLYSWIIVILIIFALLFKYSIHALVVEDETYRGIN